MPVIDITDARKEVINALNANTPLTDGTLNVVTAEKWATGELDRLILDADGWVRHLIAQVKGFGPRESFLTFTNGVAHGASVTSDGPIESVQAVITSGPYAGTRIVDPWPMAMISELERENNNPQALTLIEPHCIVDGFVVYHNRAALLLAGASVVAFNVRHPSVYTRTGACQSPAQFQRPVALFALAFAQPKDGVRTEAAGLYRTMANDAMAGLGVPMAAGAGS